MEAGRFRRSCTGDALSNLWVCRVPDVAAAVVRRVPPARVRRPPTVPPLLPTVLAAAALVLNRAIAYLTHPRRGRRCVRQSLASSRAAKTQATIRPTRRSDVRCVKYVIAPGRAATVCQTRLDRASKTRARVTMKPYHSRLAWTVRGLETISEPRRHNIPKRGPVTSRTAWPFRPGPHRRSCRRRVPPPARQAQRSLLRRPPPGRAVGPIASGRRSDSRRELISLAAISWCQRRSSGFPSGAPLTRVRCRRARRSLA